MVQRYAPIFQLAVSLEELETQASNYAGVLSRKKAYCDGALQQTPVQPFSAKYTDKNGQLVAVYLGHSLKRSKGSDCTSILFSKEILMMFAYLSMLQSP